MKKKLLSLFLVGCMAAGMLAGCGKTDDGKKTSSGDKKTEESSNGETPLVAGYSQFSAKFSPFFADTAYDQDAVAMTQVSLSRLTELVELFMMVSKVRQQLITVLTIHTTVRLM